MFTMHASYGVPSSNVRSEQPMYNWALAKRDLLLVVSPMNALTTTIVIAAVFIEERNEDKMDSVVMVALLMKND